MTPGKTRRELTRALILALLDERGERDALVYLPRSMERLSDMAQKLLAIRPEGERSEKVDILLTALKTLS